MTSFMHTIVAAIMTLAAIVSPSKSELAGTWTMEYSESRMNYVGNYTNIITYKEDGQFVLKGLLLVKSQDDDGQLFRLDIHGGGTYTLSDGQIIYQYDAGKTGIKPDYTDTPAAVRSLVNKLVIPNFRKGLTGRQVSVIQTFSSKEMRVLATGDRPCTYKRSR